jgi:hypothetical protein
MPDASTRRRDPTEEGRWSQTNVLKEQAIESVIDGRSERWFDGGIHRMRNSCSIRFGFFSLRTIKELETFHDVVVGRELTMTELEKENARLGAHSKWSRIERSECTVTYTTAGYHGGNSHIVRFPDQLHFPINRG